MRWALVGVVVAAAIILYAFFHAALTPARRVRSLPKWLWLVAIIVLPVVGAGLWFCLGAPWASPAAQRPVSRGLGPDDDPEFLRRLELERRQRQRELERRVEGGKQASAQDAAEARRREAKREQDANGEGKDEGTGPEERHAS